MRNHWKTISTVPISPEQCAVKLWEAARAKASQRKLDFDLSFHTVLKGVLRGRCEVTGIPFDMRAKPHQGTDLPFRASLDRIDNRRGYHDDNVQVVVKIYNQAKFSWEDEDVLTMAVSLVSHQVGLVLAYKKEQAASLPLDE